MHPGFTRKDVIKKVKRAFHRISPARNRHGGPNFLLVMNIPPLMGRRDSALQCMVDLMQVDFFTLSETKRCSVYRKALELLVIVIASTDKIAAATHDLKNEREKRLSNYFTLLHELIESALALVEPTVTIQNFNADIQQILGPKSSLQIRQLEDTLCESEINIVQAINDFIEISQAQLIIDREVSLRSLPRQNQEKYTKSFNEFRRYYNQSIESPDSSS